MKNVILILTIVAFIGTVYGQDWESTPENDLITNSETNNVGIGTSTPKSNLSVGGKGSPEMTIWGETSHPTGVGVYGWANNKEGSVSYGGQFITEGLKGIGVYGIAINDSSSKSYGEKTSKDG